MEGCECLPLNSKFARKSVLVKTKLFNRKTVISINQLFKVLSTGTTNTINDVDDLKQRLISVWAEFKQSVIDKAIDQWWPRLRACVRASISRGGSGTSQMGAKGGTIPAGGAGGHNMQLN